ncbi:MAG: DUF2283 domain-containing protein [bacterium]
MNLDKREITISSGETAWYEYDRKGDLLEIIFRPGEATGTVELTESIILRLDVDKAMPLSLSFISFSRLLPSQTYGELHFQLLAEEWPEEIRNKIWTMLKTTPLSDFLKLSSYAPAHTHQIMPMAAIRQSHFVAQAA